jgi:hypothetical protein
MEWFSMLSLTVDRRALQALLGWSLLFVAFSAFGQSDQIVNNLPRPGGGGMAAGAELGESIGRLMESLMSIFGIYYTFKGVLIYAKISSGKAGGQGETMGGAVSHLVAGAFAYHSRAFFSMVHNTIPMLPDFGRLVYDAELMRSLMQ